MGKHPFLHLHSPSPETPFADRINIPHSNSFFLYLITGWFIKKFAWFFSKSFGLSGAEAVVAAASPFIGQGENCILTKPFVKDFTDSEFHQALTSGFATIAGSVFLT